MINGRLRATASSKKIGNVTTLPQHATLDYDRQAREHYWHPEALFGLAYEYLGHS